MAEHTTEPELTIGTVIGGKYRVLEVQAAAGAELRCSALHEGTGRRVQLRVLAHAADQAHGERMLRAARASGCAPHAHLLGVIDSGIDAEGRIFVVYEHFEAVTARALIVASGALPLSVAADVVQQLARALGSLHQRGVVHRLVRPEHVLVARTEFGMRAKLTGFELAVVPPRFRDPAPLPRGFSRFAAPETRRDPHDASPRADVFALGVLLRFLATGSELSVAELPATAERIVERATADDAEARYPHAEQFATALGLLLPTQSGAGSLVPSDPLVADVRYFHKLCAQAGGGRADAIDDACLWHRAALVMIEAVYARAGRAGWATLAAAVPAIDALLPRSDGAQATRHAPRVSARLVTQFLEAADAHFRTPDDVPFASLPGIGASISQRGLRRVFPAYPAQLTVSAWLDSLPALYAALFAAGEARVSARTDHGARLDVRQQGAPSLALTALFAGLVRAELVRLRAEASVRMVASAALGDATDSFDIAF